ncbi:MAG TPA: hybrid sensor histidine kinase/response regulator [Mycobacteriales bacterium]|nr:hybrid sensor histidine kinase/response regulator [Mycobacteriales bacterium]
MTAWGDDPELLATFHAEVEERLASLQAGLLALETHASPRQVVTLLFRDAHTVKGSARMLGLDGVLHVAHNMEDLLGALRDGRFEVRKDHIDLLLAACDGIARALPGEDALPDAALQPLVDALASAVAGADEVAVPVLEQPAVAEAETADLPEPSRQSSDSVRVAASKVYDLLDAVGEADLGARRVEQTTGTLLSMAAEQARWVAALRQASTASDLPPDVTLALHRLVGTADEMTSIVRGLRELVEGQRSGMALVRDGAMSLAMVPVRRVFAALPRIVRDVAQATGKEVLLETSGEDVELDKQVLDGIADALKHLVINAVDHGCESPAERAAMGKPAQAVVSVSARSVGGTVVIEVADDGAGVDEDAVRDKALRLGMIAPDSGLVGSALLSLLFTPAFSTNETVTETSGRGVGLDVVRNAVEDLGGSVEIRSERGTGTTFVLVLPVTLGVLRCLVARVGDERYAVPVPGVVESLSLRDAEVHTLAGAPVVLRHGVSVPLLDLGAALGLTRAAGEAPRAALVVRHTSGSQIAWAVDRLEGESELVVKDLGAFLGRVPYVAGATIDGDGSVVCLLDLRELADRATGVTGFVATAAPSKKSAAAVPGQKKARVLVVEDSVGVRELERVILEGAGYHVETAVDGLDGASRLRDEPADLVLSDVEMPGMDGFALTRTIRRTKGWENVPVVIMTSRGEDHARQAGLDAGCSAYLLKNEFDQEQLVSTVRRLVGR